MEVVGCLLGGDKVVTSTCKEASKVVCHGEGWLLGLNLVQISLGAKNEWGLSPKANVRVLHTAQLDVTMGNYIYEKLWVVIPSMPHYSPLPKVNTLGSDEGRMQHNELMDLVTKLSDIVLALETDLKQTKKVYGDAYTKLIMKVKKLEKIVKTSQARRKAKIVVSAEEVDLEDPSKEGRKIEEIDQDLIISLIQHDADIQERYEQDMKFDFDAAKEVSTAKQVSTAGAAVTTASVDISPASPTRRVSTADDITMAETLVYIKRSASKTKDKAVRLQEEFDEEERQRTARVQEAAQSFTHEEWENIRARVKADEELTQRLQTEERNKYSEVDQAKMLVDLINQRKRYFAEQKAKANRKKPMTQAQQRTYVSNYIKHMGSYTLKQLKKLSFDEIKELFEATMRNDLVQLWSLVKERFSSTEPTDDKERVLLVELKRLFEPDDNDELWESQNYIFDITWRLYDTCGVHHVSTKKEWISTCWLKKNIHCLENFQGIAGGGPRYIWVPPYAATRLRSCFCLFVENVVSDMRELEWPASFPIHQNI
nr:hypothetical protein [Tanacetum cinerariifolium]GEZ39321.1 hypothetical protein [Tanacetum cinerariifolium]